MRAQPSLCTGHRLALAFAWKHLPDNFSLSRLARLEHALGNVEDQRKDLFILAFAAPNARLLSRPGPMQTDTRSKRLAHAAEATGAAHALCVRVRRRESRTSRRVPRRVPSSSAHRTAAPPAQS
eukprot:1726372-Pleurochrysis_carterae.AAC.2